jgi:hypothetical protein
MGLGIPKIEQIYEFHDEPLLFTAMNERGERFVAVAIDDNGYLFARLSEDQYQSMINNETDLHETFTAAGDENLFLVTETFQEARQGVCLTDAMLPYRGEYLGNPIA